MADNINPGNNNRDTSILAEAKRLVAYPKGRESMKSVAAAQVGQKDAESTTVRTKCVKRAGSGQYPTNAPMLQEAKRQIAYPRGSSSLSDNQVEVSPDGPKESGRNSDTANPSEMLQDAKNQIAYPRGRNSVTNTTESAISQNQTTQPEYAAVSREGVSGDILHQAKSLTPFPRARRSANGVASTESHPSTNLQLTFDQQPPHPNNSDENIHSMPPAQTDTTYPTEPGAYADGDAESTEEEEDTLGVSEEVVEDDVEASRPVGGDDMTHGLAVANLVEEDSTPFDLQHAQDFDLEASQKRGEATKQFKTNLFLGILLLIAIVIILMAVLVPSKGSADTNLDDMAPTASPTTAPPSRSPSQAPTSIEDRVSSLLHDETIHAITADPSSPQGRGYQWLMEDTINIPLLSDERIKQRFALATLYFATSGDNWLANNNWLNHSVHECDWFNKPSFAMKDLLGHFYPGYLDEMFPPTEPAPTTCDEDGLYQHLWLDQNNLLGTLPIELYSLTSLQSLSVILNGLKGAVPSELGLLTSLEGLAINNIENAGTVPTEIGLLTKMRAIGLGDNNHQGSLPTEFWQLTNLETLITSRNAQLGGTIPTEITALSKLRWLVMDECDLSGTIPTELGQLKHLDWIAFYGNRLSGTLPSALGQLPELKFFTVEKNNLRGEVPSEVGLLTDLVWLSLGDNSFSGQIPSEFGLLTNLALALHFYNNSQMSGTIPTQIGLLSSLHELTLHNAQFSGQIPSELGLLSSVGALSFGNNSLSGTIPEELAARQKSLYAMMVTDNPSLSGTIPEALCTLSGACIPSVVNPCEGTHHGMYFDCTNVLCGCSCPCGDSNS
ncbi:Leucine Rich Repeat [Seminavis robusta]|uniref:Leucine Rich Repeat n=1 Tax=Seminavis robusta TaxID=568900 RepID=A0A9N8EAZ6_9STRA|nr:Leucine Rich Repeat [Seminavis robusta]|eukprot:Sro905_g218560.1 Leucine Rich Repeat (838) ;mRNA; r:28974-31602